MSNTQTSDSYNNEDDDLLPEYNFDYRLARPNRFVTQIDQGSVTVTLDPDVAEVFTTSEAVNNVLRAILSAIPKNTIRNNIGQ
jgi:hypothetical protein